jgi:hypothetical protein
MWLATTDIDLPSARVATFVRNPRLQRQLPPLADAWPICYNETHVRDRL